MTLIALCLLTAQPKLSWVTLSDGRPGIWSAKARYPQIVGPDATELVFNSEVRLECEEQFRAFQSTHARTPTGGKSDLAVFELTTILSSCKSKVVSALVTTTETENGLRSGRQLAVTVGNINGKAQLIGLGDVLRPEVRPETFVLGLVLPAVNEARQRVSLPALATLPAAMFERFVPTAGNLAWPVPPGIVDIQAALFKMPWASVAGHISPDGPLKEYAVQGQVAIPLSGNVVWLSREALPYGSRLEIRLLRDKDDPLDTALATHIIVGSSPPIPFDVIFTVPPATEDERFYLDFRITSDGKTYYRNRSAIRVPIEGWQTRHEVQLDIERDPNTD